MLLLNGTTLLRYALLRSEAREAAQPSGGAPPAPSLDAGEPRARTVAAVGALSNIACRVGDSSLGRRTDQHGAGLDINVAQLNSVSTAASRADELIVHFIGADVRCWSSDGADQRHRARPTSIRMLHRMQLLMFSRSHVSTVVIAFELTAGRRQQLPDLLVSAVFRA